ncbi:hypothetical protein MIL46_002171 [Neisseria gonorrhoeae]|uniref:Phage associated protein n=1 Tax=Neisseria gonorrhoeae TaxID=485 RepID=A0AB38HL01_NEIGO|nr:MULTISPECIES: hypothetical protein [Pseudomonadota]AZG22427.1 hypothetical protein EGH14_02850 [Neisseria gonorrhoeae]AZG23046.1 hypothetical protein EGH14_06735 [Neisseria gonorrhoeae]AZG23478.1 hypothetical protein EGH14_09545 [Neisseria gonorrhoeae]AZG29945.1 hypothetical protein EGH20_06735 [Neisseria gonorrhoeae]AZG30376.1 hypothetical protein EGH20_09555 [Neisseria gonorrhoeae]
MSFHPETAYNGGRETEPYGPSPEEIKYRQSPETAETRRMTEKQAEGHIKSIIR